MRGRRTRRGGPHGCTISLRTILLCRISPHRITVGLTPRGLTPRAPTPRAMAPLALALVAMTLLSCGHDPNVAPIVGRGGAAVELSFVGGELAGTATTMAVDCPSPERGFAEELRITLTVVPPSGSSSEHRWQVPPHTETSGLLVDGLTPGNGYRFAVVVEGAADGERFFTGELEQQNIRPGVREFLRIDLVPVARRVVLGVGQTRAGTGDAIIIPIYVSHSEPLRGIQFDLCFDDTQLEVIDLQAAGRLIEAEFDGVAGGEATPDTPYRVLLWATDGGKRLPPGQGTVVELTMRFLTGGSGSIDAALVFTDAIITDQASPGQNFTVHFFDGRVTR